MPDKLSLYNGALLECGERALASLSENGETRRLLDRAWDAGALDFVLSAGQWRFAARTVELVASPDVTPPFGYAKAYEKPVDMLRTISMCSDEFLTSPLLSYSVEQNYVFSDAEPIYWQYVSNDAAYGGDMSLWPTDFIEYVHAYLASKIIKKLNQSESDRKTIYALLDRRLRDAKSSDAMESPTKFLPMGSWVRARLGGGRSHLDRGRRNKLIG
jgi:hypothetical protein